MGRLAAKPVSARDRCRPFTSEDVVAVDWTTPRHHNATTIPKPSGGYRVAWLITPPGRTSGGHQNAFRFMSFLEEAGNQLTVYLYSPAEYPRVDIPDVRRMLHETSAYPDLDATFVRYDPSVGIVGDYDAIFASDWETAYAAYRYEGEAKRFYFTQDFEPAFFAAGSDYVVAENSYRLGFHGFSRGTLVGQKTSGRLRDVRRLLRLRGRHRPLQPPQLGAAQRDTVLCEAADAASRERIRLARAARIPSHPTRRHHPYRRLGHVELRRAVPLR
ncbi:MAG: hypothetical protein WDM88_06680 [Galbitalea sp.]